MLPDQFLKASIFFSGFFRKLEFNYKIINGKRRGIQSPRLSAAIPFLLQDCLFDCLFFAILPFWGQFSVCTHDRSPTNLHGPLRAELLTAEAVNTNLSVNLRFPLFHRNCFRRTYMCAITATDTSGGIKLRERCQDPCCNEIRYLSR